MEPKQKQCPVVDVTGDGSKVQCCKEQYCTGTWNVRSMNQGKLEVVKQEMVSMNIHIWGISEIKWTGNGEFNSDDHWIYYCGQQSLRRNRVAPIVNKRLRNSVLGYSLKTDRMISVQLQGKSLNITVILVYATNTNAEETEIELFYEDLQDLIELTLPKDVLECKSRKSRDTWSDRQIWPWCTQWSRAKANRVWPRKHTGHSKHPLATTQEKTLHMDITR